MSQLRRTPPGEAAISSYEFVIVDVFTETAFGGNQLTVVPNANGLSGETMQQIAREFNFAESTFVVPGKRAPPTRSGSSRPSASCRSLAIRRSARLLY